MYVCVSRTNVEDKVMDLRGEVGERGVEIM